MADNDGVAADAPMPMLVVDVATRRITDVSDQFLELAGTTRDDVVGAEATQFLIEGPSPAWPLLVIGQIDGYEATRLLRYPDGREAEVHVWAHAFDTDRPPRSALFVLDEMPGANRPQWSPAKPAITVLGSVDSEWRVDRITADVEALLGYVPSDVTGRAFLAGVNPGDFADLLTGLGQVERSQRSVVVRLRLRGADGGWQWCRACLGALQETPAFAFMLSPVEQHLDSSDLARQLQERMTRIAYEVQAASSIAQISALPTTTDQPALGTLTSREWQVVSALQRGQRGTDVARQLSIAPSTVRNHLSSVYRKLGVRSQVALLAELNRSEE